MITSFADQGSEDIFNGEDTKAARKTLPTELVAKAGEILDQLNAAQAASDMRIPPGRRLEKLKGDFAGHYSVRINDQYRITFKWQGADAQEVRIVDYH